MSAERTEIARQQVARFVARFDESYRRLAWYAALPLVLTPELLNYLRNHFLRGQTPWEAEADLLLSELCRPVGYEQFAMAPEVRAWLIGEMREQLGEAPMREVARLLIRYVRQLSRMSSPFSRDALVGFADLLRRFFGTKRTGTVMHHRGKGCPHVAVASLAKFQAKIHVIEQNLETVLVHAADLQVFFLGHQQAGSGHGGKILHQLEPVHVAPGQHVLT